MIDDDPVKAADLIMHLSDALAGDAPPGAVHAMECIDCHNRVGHHYRSPDELLNALFATGVLDYTLPALKQQSARLFHQQL